MSAPVYLHGCCADKACTDQTCMQLPKGSTCGGCLHFRHCATFYAHEASDCYCDFFPRRFKAVATKAEGGAA